jgi:hypothetical protein
MLTHLTMIPNMILLLAVSLFVAFCIGYTIANIFGMAGLVGWYKKMSSPSQDQKK